MAHHLEMRKDSQRCTVAAGTRFLDSKEVRSRHTRQVCPTWVALAESDLALLVLC